MTYQCKFCEFETKWRESLRRHHRATHPKIDIEHNIKFLTKAERVELYREHCGLEKRRGVKRTSVQKDRIRAATRNFHASLTRAERCQRRAWSVGKKHSEEHRLKISHSLKSYLSTLSEEQLSNRASVCMKATQKGIFRPANPTKYQGDPTQIVYRSGWELQVFKWCDQHPDVVTWSSEEIVIPYVCKTDNRMHRYFPDLKITFSNNNTYIVEIKPANQTVRPVKKPRTTRKQVTEVLTFVKNISKWKAAEQWCKDRNYLFQVWTENELKKLGIKIYTGSFKSNK